MDLAHKVCGPFKEQAQTAVPTAEDLSHFMKCKELENYNGIKNRNKNTYWIVKVARKRGKKGHKFTLAMELANASPFPNQ
jgi:hypothetical protein